MEFPGSYGRFGTSRPTRSRRAFCSWRKPCHRGWWEGDGHIRCNTFWALIEEGRRDRRRVRGGGTLLVGIFLTDV